MPQEINMTNHVCIMYLMVRVECEAYSCIQKFGGNKFMTSENELKSVFRCLGCRNVPEKRELLEKIIFTIYKSLTGVSGTD